MLPNRKNSIFVIIVFSLCIGILSSAVSPSEKKETVESKSAAEKYYDLTIELERTFKNAVKNILRSYLPKMMALNDETNISRNCSSSLMKYMMGLSKAKLWAAKLLDASSKIPPGVLVGTFADFGAFDECLDVEVKRKDGTLDFRGRSCAIEARPPLPPMPVGFSIARTKYADNEQTLGAQFREAYQALHHKQLRLMVCVPSSCTLQDMQLMAKKIGNTSDFDIRIPQCYVKEELVLQPIHFAVITCLSILALLCIAGTLVEIIRKEDEKLKQSFSEKILLAFSLPSNTKRLFAASGGSKELKCIHGIRALGMCWVILGHTYVFMSFEILKEPAIITSWFNDLPFEVIHNGWIAVETFFLLSGILVSYGGLKGLAKTNGRFNVPLLVLRRYIKLTPPLLLLMGLVFFLPLISSGPFWYEQVDPQIESCRKYWWTSLLYFSNWWGIDKGCILTTWYLSADFQLHILSLIVLMIVYRYSKVGLSILVGAVLCSCAAVGYKTFAQNLSATIQLSSGDNDKVFEMLNRIHISTVTHLGPHCIGLLLGYCIYKYKDQKMNKFPVIIAWCLSTVITLCAIYGSNRFSTGEETSVILTVLYAAVHRTAFICGLAWVTFACITGYGGPVNQLLSLTVLTPMSRLSFMVYLLHPLVIWMKLGSLRERPMASHYEYFYSFITNTVISFFLAVPFYLLLEAPLSNLDRMAFSSSQANDNPEKEKTLSKSLNGVVLTKMTESLSEQEHTRTENNIRNNSQNCC